MMAKVAIEVRVSNIYKIIVGQEDLLKHVSVEVL